MQIKHDARGLLVEQAIITSVIQDNFYNKYVLEQEDMAHASRTSRLGTIRFSSLGKQHFKRRFLVELSRSAIALGTSWQAYLPPHSLHTVRCGDTRPSREMNISNNAN